MKFGLNAMVGQSGGPTAAINATLCGVIRGCFGKFSSLYGMRNGIEGLLDGDFVCLNHLFGNEAQLELLAHTPSAILGSCRMQLPSDFSSPIYGSIFDALEKYSVDCFFYIGGNDSMDTVAKLSRYAKEKGVAVSFIGIPKTIDNDLALTDHTPGYGSCAKYIATTVAELYRDVSVYRAPSVTVVEVMGRETGWLGCACALPTVAEEGGCQLIYLPECSVSTDTIISDVDNFLRKNQTLLIGISEGACPMQNGARDSFGHTRISGGSKAIERRIYQALRCKVRSIELNLPQRCACHLLSKTDIEESLQIGEKAVEMALLGQNGVMASFVRNNGEYAVDIVGVDSSLVANRVKAVPPQFIDAEKRFVTKECIQYMAPLILGEIHLKYKRGLPHYFNLR